MTGISLPLAGDGESRLPSCFSDRRSRIKWELRASIILLHVTFIGALFVLDRFMINKLKDDPWCTVVYLVLFAATLFQYLYTSCSSPGYVIDAARAANEAHATSVEQRQSASVNKTLVSTKGHNSLSRRNFQTDTSVWFKLVMVLYPPGQSASYLLLTNQTTYEIIRRQRILYLREIPKNMHLFSRGIYRNLCTICCSRDSIYTLEAVPSMEDIEARARPYTCSDVITCRCC